jgi:hypothetical protein
MWMRARFDHEKRIWYSDCPSPYADAGVGSVRIRRMVIEEFGTQSCVGTGGYCVGINEGNKR